MADREQTRRDEGLQRENAASGISGCDAIWPFDQVKAYLGMKEWAEFLLAELGQAERERDEWTKLCDERGLPHDPAGLIRHVEGNAGLRVEFDKIAAEARLAKVPALVEALKELAGYVRALLAGQDSRPELIWALEQSDEALAVWEEEA